VRGELDEWSAVGLARALRSSTAESAEVRVADVVDADAARACPFSLGPMKSWRRSGRGAWARIRASAAMP